MSQEASNEDGVAPPGLDGVWVLFPTAHAVGYALPPSGLKTDPLRTLSPDEADSRGVGRICDLPETPDEQICNLTWPKVRHFSLQHTNPKCKRGCVWRSSLTLRVSVSLCRVRYGCPARHSRTSPTGNRLPRVNRPRASHTVLPLQVRVSRESAIPRLKTRCLGTNTGSWSDRDCSRRSGPTFLRDSSTSFAADLCGHTNQACPHG